MVETEPRERLEARCEAILRAWFDDPLNRVSLEEGAYGDIDGLVHSLVSELGKSFLDHPKQDVRVSPASSPRSAATAARARGQFSLG